MRNIGVSGNSVVGEGLRELRRRLPPGWTASEPTLGPSGSSADATIRITAPDGGAGSLVLEPRFRLDPRGVVSLLEAAGDERRGARVVVSRYLSEATRARLRDGRFGYLDLTGNVRIVLAQPGLYIETQGASKDPDRQERPARSLRGAKAGRIVRTLVDLVSPPGVRELASLAKADAGYVSRVLSFLDSEALITRVGRGRIERVDWPALLRRWARDAPLESRGTVRTYLEPRGHAALLSRMAMLEQPYAITGSLAAVAVAPIAPARLATVWVADAVAAATALSLRPADAGANVMLVEADKSVFDGAAQREGIWYAAPSQVAADLLTSPGRGPQEGEELIEWMKANEEIWRR